MRNTRSVQKHTLRRWRAVNETRDEKIVSAFIAGLTVTDIHREMGVARTTIYDALRKAGVNPRKEAECQTASK